MSHDNGILFFKQLFDARFVYSLFFSCIFWLIMYLVKITFDQRLMCRFFSDV